MVQSAPTAHPRRGPGAALLLALGLLAGLAAAAPLRAELTVTTPDGRPVVVEVTAPATPGRLPCLVVAPGRGYHRGRPLIRSLVDEGRASGFVVVSFDWHYYTTGGAPSPGLTKEAADLAAVVDLAAHHPRVDPRRMVLAGKSLGTVVAARVFHARRDLAGLALLTPVIPEPAAAAWYPDLTGATRPVLVVLGAEDDDNCPLSVLYPLLARSADEPDGRHGTATGPDAPSPAPVRVPVVVVGGDHGLGFGDGTDASSTLALRAAALSTLAWATRWTTQPGPAAP